SALDLLEDVSARILGIQTLQLAENFLGALVLHLGDDDLDLDDLIATLAFACGAGHALLTHAQLLSGLCPRRNLELCPACLMTFAVDRGYLDACAERGLHRRNGDGDVDVVGNATEELVVAHADDQVKVARRCAFGARIAFAGEADALSVASAGLDAKLQRLDARDHAGAVAGRTTVLHLAAAAAARALDVELHTAAGLLHLTCAVALGALHRLADGAGALAGGAG